VCRWDNSNNSFNTNNANNSVIIAIIAIINEDQISEAIEVNTIMYQSDEK
jgi:hypothetical protein